MFSQFYTINELHFLSIQVNVPVNGRAIYHTVGIVALCSLGVALKGNSILYEHTSE